MPPQLRPSGQIEWRPQPSHRAIAARMLQDSLSQMDFRYGTSFGKASPEAYERLLLDAMAGDATLFARRDEVEEAWKFIDDIEEAWHSGAYQSGLFSYPAGSWGPTEADQLIENDGRAWRRL